MGYRQLPPADVFMKDVRVPGIQLLGEEGGGLKIFAQALNVGRLGGGTQALGIAQGAFDLALARSKERQTFGKPLIEHQALMFKLAEMQTQIETSRALVYQVARWMDTLDDITSAEVGKYCAMVKLQVSEMAMKVTSRRHADVRSLRQLPPVPHRAPAARRPGDHAGGRAQRADEDAYRPRAQPRQGLRRAPCSQVTCCAARRNAFRRRPP